MIKKYQPRLLFVFLIAFLFFQEGGRNIGVLANMSLVSDYYKNPYSIERLAPNAAVPIGNLFIIMGIGRLGGLVIGFGLSIWLNRRFKIAWIYGGLLFVAFLVKPYFFHRILRGSNGVFSVFGIFDVNRRIYNLLVGIFLLYLGFWILFKWSRAKPLTEINLSQSTRTFA